MNHGNAATRLPQSYEDARRVQLLTAELRSPPARLMVVDTPAAVTITNELGQSRTVHPDGKQESIEIQGVPFGVTSRRDGDQLIVVYRASGILGQADAEHPSEPDPHVRIPGEP